MTIQVYPEPSTGGASLPPGAESVLIDGIANQSGFTFTSSSVPAGTKVYYANAGIGQVHIINFRNEKKSILVNDGAYSVVKNATTESQISFANVSNMKQTFAFTTNLGRLTNWTSQAGTLAVLRATPRAAVIRFSSDYTTWTTVVQFSSASASTTASAGIVYGNGMWLAFTGENLRGYLFSTDGVNWTSRGSTLQIYPSPVAFYDGQQFSVLTQDSIVFSTDGLNWTSSGGFTLANQWTWHNGQGYYIMANGSVTDRRQYSFSTNRGITWATGIISGPTATTGGWFGITYGNGLWAISGINSARAGIVAVSTNSTTWTLTTLPTSGALNSNTFIYFDNGLFLAKPNGEPFACISVDGINWTTTSRVYDIIGSQAGTGLIFDNNRFFYSSADAVSVVDAPAYYAIYNGTDSVIN